MNDNNTIDRIDERILELLQLDARVPVSKLAEKIGLSVPACYRRISRLRKIGVIVKETAIVSPKSLGWPLSMIVLITLEREGTKTTNELMSKYQKEPAILDAWQITGEYDFVLRVIAQDMESFDSLMIRLLSRDDRIKTFRTQVVIKQTQGSSVIPAGIER